MNGDSDAAVPALRFLPGVGPKRAEALAAAGLHDVVDLLHHPSRCLSAAPDEYDEGDLPKGMAVQVRARIERTSGQFRGRRKVLTAHCRRADESALLVRFFNAGYLRDKLVPGEWFLFEGRCDQRQRNTLNHPRFTHLSHGSADPTAARSGCEVGYALPEGFTSTGFSALIKQALDAIEYCHDPAEQLNDVSYQAQIHALHQPTDPTEHEAARRLLAEREALALADLLRARRASVVGEPGRAWQWSAHVHERALARLPFALTPGQASALTAIRSDMQAPEPMYRLLQGDVGSGKTALALLAALAVIAEGAQVLLLAPTGVLARQHHAFCTSCLAGSQVRTAILTGATVASERSTILSELADGTCHLLIGTHALLEDAVRCRELGLCIIDEQHKFGVAQRSALVASGGTQSYHPDLLLLTATPIPRTLGLTIFGDLAVSDISGKPPGRGTVHTELIPFTQATLEADLSEALDQGGSAFVIAPLRNESEQVAAVNATSLAERLATTHAEAGVALVHGGLSEADKLAALERFRTGTARVLVSTTVVEVGVDVARATLMAVCDADRFGLAQLHQLRGRIGRGQHDGRCVLYFRREEGRERLAPLVDSTDGLAIAEADLAQRGLGEVLGRRQHGLSNFRFLDLPTDTDLVQAAHETVRAATTPLPEGLH
ncbi:MAG: helicase-related protein, partial [Planctomycetota bacterium]|nr:helicase-related protein [Planctomycetota bacterium]